MRSFLLVFTLFLSFSALSQMQEEFRENLIAVLEGGEEMPLEELKERLLPFVKDENHRRKFHEILQKKHIQRDFLIDLVFGIDSEKLEREFKKKGLPFGDEQVFPGIKPGDMYSSYYSLFNFLQTLDQSPCPHFVDIGAGIKRPGYVFKLLYPEGTYTAIEIAEDRLFAGEARGRELGIIDDKFHMILADLSDPDLILPQADYYFMYNPTNKSTTLTVFNKMVRIAREKSFDLIVKTVVQVYLEGYDWLKQPTERKLFSRYKTLPPNHFLYEVLDENGDFPKSKEKLKVLIDHENLLIQAMAVRGFIFGKYRLKMPRKKILETALKILRGNNLDAQKIILMALSHLEKWSLEIWEEVLSLLNHKNPEIVKMASHALKSTKNRNQRIRDKILSLLNHENPERVKLALKCMKLERPWKRETLNQVASLLDHENYEIVDSALNTLMWERNPDEKIRNKVISLLNHENERIIISAIYTIGGKRKWHKKAQNVLLSLFDHENPNVVNAALMTFRNQREWSKTTLERVLSLIHHSDEEIVKEVFETLRSQRRVQLSSQISQELMKVVKESDYEKARMIYVRYFSFQEKWPPEVKDHFLKMGEESNVGEFEFSGFKVDHKKSSNLSSIWKKSVGGVNIIDFDSYIDSRLVESKLLILSAYNQGLKHEGFEQFLAKSHLGPIDQERFLSSLETYLKTKERQRNCSGSLQAFTDSSLMKVP